MCIFSNAYSAWVSGSGEYYFGPETSESLACSAAEERSKLDSLKNFMVKLCHSIKVCRAESLNF